MRVADYIAGLVAAHGVKHFFTVTGGGAMHLNDAFSRNKDLHGVCLQHEQACAMAAEAYCRLSGRLALLNVTTGPGGINALNGVHGAWRDSIGMLVISGEVKQETMATSYDLPLRQLGDQEADIIAMVKGITKYAVVLRKKEDVRYVVEKALHLAQSGRPGPVWIDVPMDIQGAQIDPETLQGFTPAPEAQVPDVSAVAEILRHAKRPVIMPGTGVRISGAYGDFLRLVDLAKFPVATAFNAHDVLPEDHPCYVGRLGTVGDRGGNFAVQNADVVLILGCRLSIRQISYNWENFAPNAVKIMVDTDLAELEKPTLKIERPVLADLKTFIPALTRALGNFAPSEGQLGYLAWCQERRRRFPVVQPEYADDARGINPYIFADKLFDAAGETDVIVTANATACVTTFQAAKLKAGQRMFSNSGSASMGYDLPAAIGAAHAAPERRIICLSGDGSFIQFCEIKLDPAQGFARKLQDGRMVSSPLHDMAPFLSREELANNMWSEA